MFYSSLFLRRNCLLKHVLEGKKEGRIKVKGRRRRRRQQPLDDLKETRGYWKLKKDALDLTLWRNGFGRYVEIKCQLDATEVFIAVLIACSTCFGHHYAHHQELKSIIRWLLPVVFRVVVFKLLVWCGAEGYVSGFQDAAAS